MYTLNHNKKITPRSIYYNRHLWSKFKEAICKNFSLKQQINIDISNLSQRHLCIVAEISTTVRMLTSLSCLITPLCNAKSDRGFTVAFSLSSV